MISPLFHSWSLGKELLSAKHGIYDVPTMVTRAGFSGIEWLDRLLPSYNPEYWDALVSAQKKAGCSSSSLSLCLELSAPPPLVAEQVDRAKVVLGLAAKLGAKALRISVGGGGALSIGRGLLTCERLYDKTARDKRPLGKMSRLAYRYMLNLPGRSREHTPPRRREAELQSLAWALAPLAGQAAGLGMKLGLENHYGPTSHAEDLLRILELSGNGLGVCLDTGNFYEDQDPVQFTKAVAEKVVHVHFKVRSQGAKNEGGAGVYFEMLRVLKDAGYSGQFSVEYEGPGDGLEGAKAGAELLKRLW